MTDLPRPLPRPLPSHPDLEITGCETRFKRFLSVDVFRFRHRLFSGEWSGERVYDVIRHGGAVAVLLYDPERDAVVLVEQFRLPPLVAGFSPWIVEIVAGLLDHEGETAEEVARREAVEEAGVAVLGDLVHIQKYLPTPGNSEEVVEMFCGRVDAGNAAGIHGLADEHEDIRVVVRSVAELEAMLDAGQIETGHTLIAVYWLLRHRDALRRKWGAGGQSA